jgi:protease II
MVTKIAPACLSLLLLISSTSYGKEARQYYTPTQYLKNYALSACIAGGYKEAKAVNEDAGAAASGYLELGSFSIDAYNEAWALSRKFLAKEYLSKDSGQKLTLMKCIDFYHSKELDQLAKKYARKK